MLKQSLSQRLLQKLSPQQIQFIKLLQLTTVDFEQKLEEELLENPSLEKGPEEELPGEKSTDDFNNEESLNDDFNDEEKVFDNDDFNVNEFLTGDEDNATFRLNEDYGSEEERKEMPVAYQQTFYDSLVDQANSNFRDKNLVLALHIIGNLEEDGYLRRDLTMIANDLAFTENIQTDEDELEKILIKIQNFDPVGVGARSLQECLLLQLYKKDLGGNKSLDLAELIISEHMEAFSRKHYDKIKSSLKINDEELKSAVAEITKLNPKPGQSQSSSRSHYITPDFTVTNEDDNLTVTLNSRNAPELRISRSFVETLQAYEKSNKDDKKLNESVQYIRQKLDGAKWFIDSVKQRQHTLTVTMNAIVEFQRKFFLEGDEYSLKPMILKDVSDKVQLDISTISRVANSKYVQTDFGIFPLKFFFSEGVKNENGEEVSNKEVKKILSDAVLNESKVKPLTDEALMDMLKEKGFSMARRTVAKYREQLNIPVARMRKEL